MPALRGPDGKIVYVNDDEVPRYTAGGDYQIVSPDAAGAAQSVIAPEDTGAGGAVRAGLGSLLSGATLGLSDVALAGMGTQGEAEQLAAERKAHPVLSGLGQAAGMVLPALISGGAATPAGYLSRLAGQGAEIGAATGGAAGAAQSLAAAAGEGAIQNAGVYLSDVALGDRDLTAEGMTGALGTGLAFGAGGAVAAHGIIEGTIAARRMFARYAEGGEKAAQAAAHEWEKTSKASLDAFDQTADLARAKLAEAQNAVEQAKAAQGKAFAGLVEAREVASLEKPTELPGILTPEEQLDILRGHRAQATTPEQLAAWDRANGERLRQLSEQVNPTLPNTSSAPPPNTLPPDQAAKLFGGEGLEFASPGADPGLSNALSEYTSARQEFDEMRARVDPDLEDALLGLPEYLKDFDIRSERVPSGEFGAPGVGGFKSQNELARLASGTDAPGVAPALEQPGTRMLRGGAKGTPEAKSLGQIAAESSPVPLAAEAPSVEVPQPAQPHVAQESRPSIEVARPSDPRVRGMELKLPDGTTKPLTIDEAVAIVERETPAGFNGLQGINVRQRFSINHEIPATAADVVDNSLTIVRPSDLVERGVMGNELSDAHRDSILEAWKGNKKLEPLRGYVTPDGKVYIEDGNHRLQAAARDNREIAVTFKSGENWEPQSGARDITDRVRADLPAHVAQQPAAAPETAPTKEPTQFTPTGREAGGSQGGKWYKDEHGQQWFGKSYGGDVDRIEGENLANRIYREFGVAAPETRLSDVSGKRMLMSREVAGKVATSAEDIARTDAKNGFVIDAWLGNHDVVGTGYDNILISGDKATRIDNGGATIWRAQGLPKDFKAIVGELESLRDTQRHAGRAFAGLTDAEVKQQLSKFAAEYPVKKAAIDEAIDGSSLSRKAKEQIKTGLHDRAAWLIDRAKGTPAPLDDAEFQSLAESRQAALTDEQRRTALGYSNNGLYAQINAPLREMSGRAGGSGLKPIAEHLRGVVTHLDSAVAASPAPRDMLLVRGVHHENAVKVMSKLQPGDVYVDPGFVSTSYDAQIGKDYTEGFGVRKGVELKISVPEGHPALPIPSEFPKEREVLLGRGGRFIVTGREIAEDGHTVIHMTVRAPDQFEAVKLPDGFTTIAKDSYGHAMFDESPDIAFGIPEYADIPNMAVARQVAYIVKPSELAEVGVLGKAKEPAGKWNGSLDLPAIEIDAHRGPSVDLGEGLGHRYTTSGYTVADGSKRLLAAAADGDRPVLVRFTTRSASPSGVSLTDEIKAAIGRAKPAAEAAAPVTDTLTGLLRGTQAALEGGESLSAIGAPARAEYAAAKAERTAQAAEHFRAKALEGRALGEKTTSFEASQLGLHFDPETRTYHPAGGVLKSAMGREAPWNQGFGAHGTWETSGMAAEERAAQAQAAALREHPLAVKQLEMAHDAALERAAAAADPVAKQEAVAEAKAIERQLTNVGARPGAVEDVAAMAKVTTRVEKAAADLVEAMGPAAPPAAQQAAAAYRAAEETANRKMAARIARAAEDHASSVAAETATVTRVGRAKVPAPAAPQAAAASPPTSPATAKSSRAGIAAAKQEKLSADAAYKRAKAVEVEASAAANTVTKAAADARAAAEADRPAAAPAPSPGRGSKLIEGAKAVGVAMELGSDFGIPGIPRPRDIPVIGPVLSAYLKYRALRAAAGRFVGRVPATAEAKAAALAAKTKDAMARAVDRSLGLIERNAPATRVALTATALKVNDALTRRAIDDGGPDAPKDASPSDLAAVRMREIAAAVANPQLVVDHVRKQTKALMDPDLIQALENHLTAMFAHLNDTAPKGPPPNPYSKTEWKPSPALALQWGRRYAVAQDPKAAFDALQAGTLTPDAAETLRVCYAKLFAMAQQRLAERAADIEHPVEYHQLVRNSLLFDQPMHASLEPENAAVLRTAYAPSAPDAPPGAPAGAPPAPSIANGTNLTALYQTFSDRRATAR